MRYVWWMAAVLLAGCAAAPDGGAIGAMTDLVNPGARQAYRAQVDDAKCQSYGFLPGTGGYANCRLELDRGRAPIRARVVD